MKDENKITVLNQTKEDIRIMNPSKERKFTFITPYQVTVMKTANELYQVLSTRQYPSGEIFASDNLEALCFLARQYQPVGAFRELPLDSIHLPFSLPSGIQYYNFLHPKSQEIIQELGSSSSAFLTNTSEGMISYFDQNNGGFWSVVGLNGFYITPGNENNMVTSAMVDPLFLSTPQARWFPNFELAIQWAWNCYIKRFYLTFDRTLEALTIPNNISTLNCWIDEHFEARMERRDANETILKMAQIYNYVF